jgi:membrane protease YdiL (CAAX protease family)
VIGGVVILSVGLVAAAGSQALDRQARGAGAFPGPSPVLVFAASIPLAFLGVNLIAIPFALAGIRLEGPGAVLVAVIVQAIVYLGLVRLLVVNGGSIAWRDLGVTRPDGPAMTDLLIGAAFALPVIAVTALLGAALLAVFPVTPTSPLPPTGEPLGFALGLLAAAVVAPLGEELFFRAFATTAWVRALGIERGIVRAGLFFAFAHVITVDATSVGEGAALALIAFLTRVPIGLVLCWLFVRRGTIWAPIGLHAAFNAIPLVLVQAAAFG